MATLLIWLEFAEALISLKFHSIFVIVVVEYTQTHNDTSGKQQGMLFIPGQWPNQVKYCTDAKYFFEKNQNEVSTRSFHVTVVVLVSAQLCAEGMCSICVAQV